MSDSFEDDKLLTSPQQACRLCREERGAPGKPLTYLQKLCRLCREEQGGGFPSIASEELSAKTPSYSHDSPAGEHSKDVSSIATVSARSLDANPLLEGSAGFPPLPPLQQICGVCREGEGLLFSDGNEEQTMTHLQKICRLCREEKGRFASHMSEPQGKYDGVVSLSSSLYDKVADIVNSASEPSPSCTVPAHFQPNVVGNLVGSMVTSPSGCGEDYALGTNLTHLQKICRLCRQESCVSIPSSTARQTPTNNEYSDAQHEGVPHTRLQQICRLCHDERNSSRALETRIKLVSTTSSFADQTPAKFQCTEVHRDGVALTRLQQICHLCREEHTSGGTTFTPLQKIYRLCGEEQGVSIPSSTTAQALADFQYSNDQRRSDSLTRSQQICGLCREERSGPGTPLTHLQKICRFCREEQGGTTAKAPADFQYSDDQRRSDPFFTRSQQIGGLCREESNSPGTHLTHLQKICRLCREERGVANPQQPIKTYGCSDFANSELDVGQGDSVPSAPVPELCQLCTEERGSTTPVGEPPLTHLQKICRLCREEKGINGGYRCEATSSACSTLIASPISTPEVSPKPSPMAPLGAGVGSLDESPWEATSSFFLSNQVRRSCDSDALDVAVDDSMILSPPEVASEEDFKELLEFLSACFVENDIGNLHPRLYRPQNLPNSCIMRANGRIQGFTILAPHMWKVGEATLKVGGIGGVATHPRYRGVRVMKEILNHQIAAAISQGFDMIFLGGLRPRYARAGFDTCGKGIRLVFNQSGARSALAELPPKSCFRVRPVKQNDDDVLKRAMEWHSRQNLRVYRGTDPQEFLLFLKAWRNRVLVAYNDDDTPVAVLSVKGGDYSPQVQISEILAENPLVASQILQMWLDAHDEVEELTVLLSPLDSPMTRELSTWAERMETGVVEAAPLFQIFNWVRVVDAFLKLRLSMVGSLPSASVVLDIEKYGLILLVVGDTGKTASCTALEDVPAFGPQESVVIKCNSSVAMRLLFGPLAPLDVIALPDSVALALSAWCPLPLYWATQDAV